MQVSLIRQNDLKLPLLIYDGDCRFCRMWVERWRAITGRQVEYAPYQEVADSFPEIPLKKFQKSVQMILPNGKVFSGAYAVFRALSFGGKTAALRMYRVVPGFAVTSEWFYRFVASRRDFFYKVSRLLWGKSVLPASHTLTRWVFLRLLGGIYLIAFASFGFQILGLIGSNGILPVQSFLDAVGQSFGTGGFWQAPTLFWLNSGDVALQAVILAGVILSILLIVGFAQRVVAGMLFVLYLSLVSAGQVFMAFQWDILLLEVGFLAIFFAPSHIWPKISKVRPPSKVILWLHRIVLFRLIFASGVVKLVSGDSTWRDLTALNFHYETQPLPNPIAWYAHQLPEWFDKLSVLGTFGIELIVPFLIFTPRKVRFFGAALMTFLQILIILTGNYTFFNLLTLALVILLLDDRVLIRLKAFVTSPLTTLQTRRGGQATSFSQMGEGAPIRLGGRGADEVRDTRARETVTRVLVAALATVIIFLGLVDISRLFRRTRVLPKPVVQIVRVLSPFRIVSGYGLFAVMTTSRPEIIVQGSNDGQIWLDYKFKYKPVDLKQAPKQVAPHQPRLDWQMWFAALTTANNTPWFFSYAQRTLEGSPEVLALLEQNPFPDGPPRFIRAVVYDYHFTDFKTRKSTGRWWEREFRGIYLPASTLREPVSR